MLKPGSMPKPKGIWIYTLSVNVISLGFRGGMFVPLPVYCTALPTRIASRASKTPPHPIHLDQLADARRCAGTRLYLPAAAGSH